jgi:hypothetical protein
MVDGGEGSGGSDYGREPVAIAREGTLHQSLHEPS